MVRRLILALALGLAGAGSWGWWARGNAPVMLEPVPGGKLQSLSFAPYRDGQSPLQRVYAGRAQIAEDLAALAPQVRGVRTYTALEGMEVVPELARGLGLTVTQGVWLGSETLINAREVAAGIHLANTYPDSIPRLIVGNEVLLRNDLAKDKLIEAIDRVRAAVKQPVGYADVWEYWLKHPDMADHVDFIVIHLLPYWEDEPVAVEHAAQRFLDSYRRVAARFPGKPIMVGEAGWPTAGRTRGPAVPGVVNKARFDTSFIRAATEMGFDYNLVEAFDQSWKISLEGTVGGKWGLYTSARTPKFLLGQPVVEDGRWRLKAGATLLLGWGAALLVLARGARLALPAAALLVLVLQALAAALVWGAAQGVEWHYYWQDVLLAALVSGLSLPVAGGAVRTMIRVLAARPVLQRVTPEAMVADEVGGAWGLVGTGAFWFLAGIAAVWTLLLIGDGRYRDVPVAPFLASSLAVAALLFTRLHTRPPGLALAPAFSVRRLFGACAQREAPGVPLSLRGLLSAFWTHPLSAALALVLLVGGPVLVGVEEWRTASLANREVLVWMMLQWPLAVPFVALILAVARNQEPLPPFVQL